MKPTPDRWRGLAVPHTLFDGQVTVWLLPYRSVAVDVVLETLSPDGAPLDTGRTLFALCDTLTVDAAFALRDDAPPALRALELYWRERPDDVRARCALFLTLIDASVASAWWSAYEATRPALAGVPEEDDDRPEV